MNERKAPPRNHFPLAVEKVRQDGTQQTHDRLWIGHGQIITGALELEIEVLAPVHVGCGSFTLVDDQPVKDLARRAGAPVIPGSSIKGVCRQTHEVLTQSGSPFNEGRGHNPPPLSPSATLFGSLAGQGRVSFDDAEPVAAVELRPIRLSVPYPPQGAKGRRFYGPMPEGAEQEPKIPALAFPAGARLRTVLRFRNVFRYELGSVLYSLGLGDPPFHPKLGGGKYDPFGWVRFGAVRYRLAAGLGPMVTPWKCDTTEVDAFCADLLEAAILPPAGTNALGKLQRRMQAPLNERGGAA